MNWNWVWVGALATLVMGSWNFGMAQERPVIRAQNGVVYPESYPTYHEGEYYEYYEDDHGFSPFGGLRSCWTYISTLGGKQAGGYPYGNGAYAGRDPRQLDFQYKYRYRAPKNLRYPPANQPAGVVVYPYYTLKGPDDFFLNETLGN